MTDPELLALGEKINELRRTYPAWSLDYALDVARIDSVLGRRAWAAWVRRHVRLPRAHGSRLAAIR